jgi:hypothetical protein
VVSLFALIGFNSEHSLGWMQSGRKEEGGKGREIEREREDVFMF